MRLFIPDIGMKIILEENWNFVLQSEYRNHDLMEKMKLDYKCNQYITLPKGLVLTIDRIYIKKGLSKYSSVTFRIAKIHNKKSPYAGTRFWASLNDVNKINFIPEVYNVEATDKFISMMNEIKINTSLNDYKKMETIFIGNNNLTTYKIYEDGISFYENIVNTLVYNQLEINRKYPLSNSSENTYDFLIGIVNKFFRKYKLQKFLDENIIDNTEKTPE